MTHQEEGDLTRLVDMAGAVDVGQGYTLAWCVGPDGSQWPILLDTRVVEDQLVPAHPAAFTTLAPHEMTGRLPEGFQQFWCGAPTRAGRGQPCRSRVDRPGGRCRHHPDESPTPVRHAPLAPAPAAPAAGRAVQAQPPDRAIPARRPRGRAADDVDAPTLFDLEPEGER